MAVGMCPLRLSRLQVLQFLLLLVATNGVWIRGKKDVPANSALFISKFVFDSSTTSRTAGSVDFEMLSAEPATGSMKILLLNDQSNSYPDKNSRWPGFDCEDKRLLTVAKKQQIIQMSDLQKGDTLHSGLHTTIYERLRPRYWYVVALDCSGVDRTIEYELHLQNPLQGMLSEVSMDHCGVWSLGLFFCMYSINALLQLKAIFMQSTVRTKHPLRLVLTFGMLGACWSLVFTTLDTYWLATKGQESFILYFLSKGAIHFSKFCLLLICILLSKGKAITHELYFRDLLQGTIIVFPLVTFSFILTLWGEFDESRNYTTSSIYSSWVGVILVLVDLVLLGLYSSNLRRTHAEETDAEKRAFYGKWGAIYSSAFLSLPLSAVVAACVAPESRNEVMFVVNNCVHATLLTVLMLGLRPERTQSVFNIDKSLACTFGNEDAELKSGLKGDFDGFVQDSFLSG